MAEKIKLGSTGNWGVKPNGVLAYNDEDSVFKAIELQSSRASGATYVGEDGLIKDAEVGVPRIDWTNGVGELLLEPLSKNDIHYSEDLDATASSGWWNNQDSTSVLNFGVSPDGQTNSTLLYPTTSGANRSLNENFGTILSGGTYTFSVFAKASGKNWLRFLHLNASGGNATTHFDLQNGVVGTTNIYTNVGIEDYGNGWYRCYATVVASGATDIVYLMLTDADDSNLSTTNGTDGIEIWGCQIENLSYPTSYIRTSGTSETRIADAVTGNSSLGQVINSSEGVLYFEGSALTSGGGTRVISLNDGTSANNVYINFNLATNQASVEVLASGSQYNYGFTITETNNNKLALKWKSNDFAIWLNGTELNSSLSGNSPVGLDRFSFDYTPSSLPFYGRIREVKVYDTALTDAELQSLTTL